MNKRTLLIALVLLSAVCAYASTVTIIYPTPVEGLPAHIADTTTAHSINALAGINGSATQNFSVATLTVGNISGMSFVSAHQNAASGSVATGVYVQLTSLTEDEDAGGEFAAGVFTVAKTGLYEVSVSNLIVYNCFDSFTSSSGMVTAYVRVGSGTRIPFARGVTAKGDAPTTYCSVNGSYKIRLVAGQTVTFWIAVDAVGSTDTATIDGFTDGRSALQITRVH